MASASIISDDLPFLPFDIITNILKRLPIKSIVRFQCVCKEWKNLFKTPSFTHDNYHFSPDHNNPFLLLHETINDHNNPFLLLHELMYGPPHSLSLLNHNLQIAESLTIPNSLMNSWTIIGCCNGLICIESYGTSNSIGVWNPVMREVRNIPLTNIDCGATCQFGFGFGFSSVVNDYKIVRFYNQAGRKRKEVQHDFDRVEVFSLSTGSWKELEFSIGNSGRFRRFIYPPENIDGTISWIGKGDTSCVIVSFNVATEVFTLTPIADSTLEPIERTIPHGLGVYNNKLEVHFFSVELDGLRSVSVCVMEEVTNESGKRLIPVKKYRFGPMAEILFPMSIWKHELVCINEEKGDGALTLFNLITNERRDFDDLNGDNIRGVYTYEKSLVSVWNNN